MTTEQDTATVPDSTDSDGCPMCGSTTGVQPITGTSPKVQAWSCAACETRWAITTANPQPYLDRLAATVEEIARLRWTLRQIIVLAESSATITDRELRTRLLVLAESCAR